MARCGCAAGCSCLVVGSSPVVVSGNGSPGAPFTVSLAYGTKVGCSAIAACVGANLGAGLLYDEATGTLQAAISRDPENGLTFGSDNGLYASGAGGGGGGPLCQTSVAALPAAPGVVGALNMAGLLGPYNSPYMLEYCLATGVDIIHMQTCATSDGAAWISESDTGVVSVDRSTAYETAYARYQDSASVIATMALAGNTNDPYSGEAASVERTTTGSGWYGWLSANYQYMLLPQVLDRVGGKAVVLLDCRDAGEPANVESANVQAVLRGVREYCSQQWTMIGVNSLANAGTVLNAGVEAVLMLENPATYGATTLPVTVASLQTAGVGWIALSYWYADSVFQAYINAGIKVLMMGATRHVHRTRMATLGCRGFLGPDPVYTRGPVTGVEDYRKTRDPWARRRVANGQLTHLTDRGLVTGEQTRGYHRHPSPGTLVGPKGFMLPARFGNGGGAPSVMCGWECPLQVPTSYSISIQMMADTLPIGSSGKFGLLFGMENDENRFSLNGSDGNPYNMPGDARACYRAYQRVNGEIGLAYFTDDRVYLELQTLVTPALVADVWNTYTLTVTPTTVTWRRTLTNGTNYTVTSNNAMWRGGYFAVEKEELHPENSQYGFISGYRNLTVNGQGDA